MARTAWLTKVLKCTSPAKDENDSESILSYDGDVDLLQDLLDLHSHGEGVKWPDGLNSRSAAKILKAKLQETRNSASQLESFVIDSDDDAVLIQ